MAAKAWCALLPVRRTGWEQEGLCMRKLTEWATIFKRDLIINIYQMKKTLLTMFLASLGVYTKAQVVADTVSVGASYANQVWYSLRNDEQGSAPKNNWDLAFDASGFGSTILINSITGMTLWNYPKSDTSGWATVDTTGLSTWSARYNSDKSWADGAMGRYADPANANDLDWGIYNLTTHVVTGDSLYIVKLSDGSYKKLRIVSLSGSVYTFKYANIDGTDPRSATLNKSTYSGKNFGYYSLINNSELNREPASALWDLTFTQYTTFIPTAYTVTGILGNKDVELVKCSNLPNKLTFTDYGSATFSYDINTVGYNWKTFNGTAYDIKDSTVYFARLANGDVWKLIFTGFAGSSTGNNMFSKERLYTQTGVSNTGATVSLAIYPNPANGQNVNVLFSAKETTTLVLTDMAGRVVRNERYETPNGLTQVAIPTQTLLPGIYVVTLMSGGTSVQQRVVLQ